MYNCWVSACLTSHAKFPFNNSRQSILAGVYHVWLEARVQEACDCNLESLIVTEVSAVTCGLLAEAPVLSPKQRAPGPLTGSMWLFLDVIQCSATHLDVGSTNECTHGFQVKGMLHCLLFMERAESTANAH